MLVDYDWKNIVEPVMKHYCDVTDGSYIEAKETALVWHYEEADPVFGSSQAKELQDHLRDVLAKEPVSVKSGHQIVEVNPQVRQHLIISRASSLLDSYCYTTLNQYGKGATSYLALHLLCEHLFHFPIHSQTRKEQASKFHR
jgi:hypothetical protein